MTIQTAKTSYGLEQDRQSSLFIDAVFPFHFRYTYNEALSVVQEASILYKSCQELGSETQDLLHAIRTMRRESSLKMDELLATCRSRFDEAPFHL
jgi:hypothetical protein